MEKFTTTDKPLSASQAREIERITDKDIERAIKFADKTLIPFLKAKSK
jgi:hypothetical protein